MRVDCEPGNPPLTCRGCATDLPRRKDGKPHQNRAWCGRECETDWLRNHYWGVARQAALVRDGHRCVRCSWHANDGTVTVVWSAQAGRYLPTVPVAGVCSIPLVVFSADSRDDAVRLLRDRQGRPRRVDRELEVNHITPRQGEGYGTGCHNHLDNLETLCHPCHVEETTRQRRGLPSWRHDPRPLVEIEGGAEQLDFEEAA